MDDIMIPKVHKRNYPNVGVYTYVDGSVRAFYYAHYLFDSPSDCITLFVVGDSDD